MTAKQCAAAQFKVTARRFWGNLDRENPSPIPENEKQFVRDNIVEVRTTTESLSFHIIYLFFSNEI